MCCQARPRSPISKSLITVKITNTVDRLRLTITQTIQHFTSPLSQLQLRNKLPQGQKASLLQPWAPLSVKHLSTSSIGSSVWDLCYLGFSGERTSTLSLHTLYCDSNWCTLNLLPHPKHLTRVRVVLLIRTGQKPAEADKVWFCRSDKPNTKA